MVLRIVSGVLMTICALGLASCASSTAPESTEGKTSLNEQCAAALQRFQSTDSTVASRIGSSAGYAIFPSVTKGGAGIGGAYGKGEVFDRSGNLLGYCDLSQGTIGVQLGGQEYRELILFQDQASLDRFKQGNFALAAQASAVAAKEGASANADYKDGVMVFTQSVGGLMFEASVGGQKFNFQPR